MRFGFSVGADAEFELLPSAIQKILSKQISFLVHDIQHPSLHAKKYEESTGLWQARINRSWRMYFFISGDTYLIVRISKHPK